MPALNELVSRIPDHDRGRIVGLTHEEAEKLHDAVLAGGKEHIVGLIDMLKEVDDGEDYRARYLLHCVVMHVGAKESKNRALLADTIANALGVDRPSGVKEYLLQRLQMIATKQQIDAAAAHLLDEKLSAPAAAVLTVVGRDSVGALKKALPKAPADSRIKLNIKQAIELLG